MTINLSAKQDLPIAALEQDIIKLIENNQVVILSGETGSGKSTQLPKICAKICEQNNKNNLNNQQIAHTQPRRVAAVSLAQRISDECNTKLGEYIGYQVRFDQKFSDNTKIKLMTDGMLLTEIQADRLLKKYHTIIIDEAHERSLNIDFLLGYIKYLLPKRPDLKIIITSATIEVDLFSRHFNNAPVIKVPGRTYPVDIIYQDIYENSSNISSGAIAIASVNSETSSGSSFGLSSVISSVINSIDFLLNDTRSSLSGDILVFFATEKEIHETALLLERKNLLGVQVLKLFARLSPKEQKEIFNPGGKRRVILSTNVAETSVTVPKVHYVIDTGFARVSRYSYRSKMQHLPIERVSKASCNQRSGRCGRIAPGICIRLYSKEDFLSRDEQMSPEICRTNLSSVILLMLAHKLGDINNFPFLEPPDPKYIKDGYQILFELGAIKNKDLWQLTEIGKQMSRFPVDPRISRMILAGKKYHSLDYILIIASFLSAQDPKSRPVDKAQRADQLHAEFKDNKSDFIEILNLWNFIVTKKNELSNSQFKSMCQKRFLSSLKIRQWQAIYQQLVWVVKNLKIDFKNNNLNKNINLNNNNYKLIIEGAEYENLHKALMTGLVTHVSRLSDKDNKDNKKNIGLYISTRSRQGYIFPGSGLFKKKPKWLLSCYLRETQKVYFDCNAQIEPDWIEQVASHLVKKHYDEPVWSKKREQASVKEKVTLYGLEIAADKWVFYGNIDKKYAKDMLIRDGLIEGEINLKADFFTKNNELLEDIEGYEDKIRTKGVLIDPEMLFDHYDRVLPDHIVSGVSLKKWLKGLSEGDAQKLIYVKQDLENYAKSQDTRVVDLNNNNLYPKRIQLGDNKFLLSYKFELGNDADGVSVEIPLSLLKSVNNNSAINSAQWLIPALLIEKITAYIKALPKAKRKLCAPSPEYAKALYERAVSDPRVPGDIGLVEFMAESLSNMTGNNFTVWDWMGVKSIAEGGVVADYLFLRFIILNNNNKILAAGRDLNKIISDLDDTNIIKTAENHKLTQDDIKWESSWVWDLLPNEREKEISGVMVKQYPALFIKQDKDNKNKLVGIGWENDKKNQQESLYQGLIALCKNYYKPCLKKLISRSDVKIKISNLNIYWARLDLGDLGDLWDELSDFCVQEAVGLFNKKNNLEIKTKSDFKNLLVPESDIIKILNIWIDKLLELFKLESQCRVLIKKAARQLGDAQIRDIKSQLDYLFNIDFLNSKNREYLNRYQIYLKGIKIRCESAINNPLKVRQAFDKLEDYWERFIDLDNANYINNITGNLFSYRWLVEEYRISLFAQSLGCVQKVSPKILDKYWNA